MTFCPKCGTQNKDDAKFCKNCGADLREYVEKVTQEKAERSVKMQKRVPTSRKAGRLFPKIALTLFILLTLGAGITGTLVYFDIADIPAVSSILDKLNINRGTVVDKGGFNRVSSKLDNLNINGDREEKASDKDTSNAYFDNREPSVQDEETSSSELKSDETAVSEGKDDYDQCNVSGQGDTRLPEDADTFTENGDSGQEPTSLQDSYLSRIVDNAGLISDAEERKLCAQLDEISKRQQFDVVVVTVTGLEGKTAEQYANDFYDDNGYGMGENYDGILLLVSMENRDYWVSTCGFGIDAFRDGAWQSFISSFLPELSSGDYADSFRHFAERVDEFVAEAKKGRPYDTGHLPPH